jgi:hypothetical protein
MSKSCPLGHTCNECHWHIRLRGQNPQTGGEIDQDGCAIAWIPILLIENSQQQRQTAGAVESFRNEMIKGNDNFLGALPEAIFKRLS